MTQTPRQMRRHTGKEAAEPDAAPRPRRRAPGGPPRRGPSRSALFAAMIVVFVAGLFAAPFAQYYLGPRLAELSGIAELAAGRTDVGDFSRLRAIEARTDELGQELQSIAQAVDDGSAARVAALENEIGLLRQDLATLGALTERTTVLENSTASLAALESRLAGLESRPVDTGAADDIAAVNTRLADVDTALSAVRGESERLAASVDTLQSKLAQDLKEALALVEGRLAAVDRSRGVDSALAETVEALQTRTGALEVAVERSAGRAALAAAIGALRGTAERGRPFEAELQTVRALAIAHPSSLLDGPIETLSLSAGTGLPSMVGLQRSFAVLAGRAARPAPTRDAGWVGQTLDRVGSLVTVRRTGDIAGQSPEAVVARAEVRLQEGDLAGAVAEMTALEGQMPANDAWLVRARLRLTAERALDALNAGLAAIGGAG